MTNGTKKSRVTKGSVGLDSNTAVVAAAKTFSKDEQGAASMDNCERGRECPVGQGVLVKSQRHKPRPERGSRNKNTNSCSADRKTKKKKRKEMHGKFTPDLVPPLEEEKEMESSSFENRHIAAAEHERMSDLGWSSNTQTIIDLSVMHHNSFHRAGAGNVLTEEITERHHPAPHSQRNCSIVPAAPTHGEHGNHRFRCFLKDLKRFRALKILQILLSVYILVLTFADFEFGLRDDETGFIIDLESTERTEKGLILLNGDERAIAASSTFQLLCLGLARLSAWFMYPTLVFVFISKFRATTCFLNKSPLAMHLYSDTHELHVYCGWTIVICATVHAISHIARWAVQGNLTLLLTHLSGVTGLVNISSCLLICIPMTIFRKQIQYEFRKALHYFFLVFAASLVFHTPTSAIPNGGFTAYVFGTLLLWYMLDATYCYFFMTEKIDTTEFTVVPSGVRMTIHVSERFQTFGAQGGICYVCLPWVSKYEWHAFSLFEHNPYNPAERQLFIQKSGDWTTAVQESAQRPTVRPAWVQGPFPSPYNDSADAYDNQILVASGIGITPALSVIRAHKDSRRINLIWAVRDPHLVEFFLGQNRMYLDHEGWNLIFYTGQDKLCIPNRDSLSNTNICIVEGRPLLNTVISNIIFGIETRQGLPEHYTPRYRAAASELVADRLLYFNSTQRLRSTSMNEVVEDLTWLASDLGFGLSMDSVSQSIDRCLSHEIELERHRTSKEFRNHLSIGFRPWVELDGAQEYVKGLDPKLVLGTWGILYCGGAKKVQAELETVSQDYGICLHVESFQW